MLGGLEFRKEVQAQVINLEVVNIRWCIVAMKLCEIPRGAV